MPSGDALNIIQEIFKVIKTSTINAYSLKVGEQTFSCRFTDNGQWQPFPDVVKNYNTGKSFDAIYYYRQLEIKYANALEGYYFEYGVRETDWEGRMIINSKEYLIYAGFEKDNEEGGRTTEWNSRINLVKAFKMSWQLLGITSFRKGDKEHNNSEKKILKSV